MNKLDPIFKGPEIRNISRFAPSPTGYLHIGGVRSALFSWAHAKNIDGKFLVRIEDTDRNRFVPDSIYQILQALYEFGLEPDLYPNAEQIRRSILEDYRWYTHDWAQHLDELDRVDPLDFKDIYIQSLRLALYQKAAWELVKRGFAYFCFCPAERLEQVNKQRRAQGLQPGYDLHCKRAYSLDQALALIEKGERPVVRMDFEAFINHLGTDRLVYKDQLLGEIEFDLKLQNHGVLLKSDGFPTYHLAVVVDDYLMGVHTTIRGFEWVSSVPKHVLVATGLGIKLAPTVHLPIILDPKGGKLSKRHGAVSAFGILAQGYLPEAVVNFLMYLGYNPVADGEDTKLSVDEFARRFDLLKVSKNNPVFDRSKMVYFNKRYMSESQITEFTARFVVFLSKNRRHIVETLTGRHADDREGGAAHLGKKSEAGKLKDSVNMHRLSFIEKIKYLYEGLDVAQFVEVLDKILADYTKTLAAKLELLKVRTEDMLEILVMLLPFYTKELAIVDYKQIKGIKRYEASVLKDALEEFKGYLQTSGMFKNNEEFATYVRALADKYSIKHADMFMAIRLATYGGNISPPLFEYLSLIFIDYGVEWIIDKIDRYIEWLFQL